jgi:arginyl-tRNA synthetase
MIIRNLISNSLAELIERSKINGLIPSDTQITFTVERPQNPEHGDFATNIPLKLAGLLKRSPVDIANQLLPLIPSQDYLGSIWVQPPGFINFSLDPSWLTSQVDTILESGESYGKVNFGNGQRVQIEFVSVNPTGPVHVGHTRGAVLGDALGRILDFAGYNVTREYYVNDTGNQMENFYKSLYVRYKQHLGHLTEMPAGGYMGKYMLDIARDIAEQNPNLLDLDEEEAIDHIGSIGLNKMLTVIEKDLKRLNIQFDVWFREYTLHRDGHIENVLDLLREGNNLSIKDAATWFTSSSLGEDKDNVLIRSNGSPTYFAADIAYHYDKFIGREFSKVIDIWGADHQGHVSRMKTALGALGINPDKLVIILAQLVTLKMNNQLLKVSKRSGDLITLPELIDEVGPDACRYFFMSRSPDSQMEFDLELAKRESSENPVYYIQYAHARIASIIRLSTEAKIDHASGNVNLLSHPSEIDLIKKMIALPELIESIAINLEPHHLAHYSQQLATAFHWFYQQCRVMSNDPSDYELTKARLKLVHSSGVVLGRCLALMGMEAPEQM